LPRKQDIKNIKVKILQYVCSKSKLFPAVIIAIAERVGRGGGEKKSCFSRGFILFKSDNFKLMTKKIIICIAIVVGFVSAMKAGIIKVIEDGSGDYTTIQEAIDAAVWNSGDTVLVYPGEYYENINYNGKHITIASLYIIIPSVGYIYNTIIDGGQLGSCVTMNGGQSAMTINGFTIRNGLGYNAGGIYIYYATGVVKNCIIEKNIGTGIQYGGGLSIRNGTGTVMNSTIQNNTGYNGGGIMIWYSQLSISGTTVKYNHAYGPGGGIY
jgi:hypothetical protein